MQNDESELTILESFGDWINNLFNRPVTPVEDSDPKTPEREMNPKDVEFLLSLHTPEEKDNATVAGMAEAIIQHTISKTMLEAMKKSGLEVDDMDSFMDYLNDTTTANATTETPTTIPGTTSTKTLSTTTTEEPTTTVKEPTAPFTTVMAATNTTQASTENLRNPKTKLSYEELRRRERMFMIENLPRMSEIERKLQAEKKELESKKPKNTLLTTFLQNMEELFTSFWLYIPISVFLILVIICIITSIRAKKYKKSCDLKHDLDASGVPNIEVVI